MYIMPIIIPHINGKNMAPHPQMSKLPTKDLKKLTKN